MKNLRRLLSWSGVILLVGAALAPALPGYDNPGAPGHMVNISGATLFRAFFAAEASTNDWIDCDNDTKWGWDPGAPPGQKVDQLATNPYTDPTFFCVQYRGVGSGNGLVELDTYYNSTPPAGHSANYIMPAETGYINRWLWSNNGLISPPADPCHPGGNPVIPSNVDMAVLDVPTAWFIKIGSSSSADWDKLPSQSGYGTNPTKGWDSYNRSNTLKSLVNLNTGAGDPCKTVYDTQVAWVPSAMIVNMGTGIENIKQSDLRFIYTTGRDPNGFNFCATGRDSGSGTRNLTVNSLGVDPSWARGENVGNKTEVKDDANLGANSQYGNLGGSSVLARAVQNRRLGIGYNGMGPTGANTDAKNGKYEIANVMFDLEGGTAYVRPSLTNILQNGNVNNAWRIGGNESFVTVGDPLALVWDPCDPCVYYAGNGNPYGMNNLYANLYLRNIIESVDEFIDQPGAGDSENMPGYYLAKNFFLVAGIDYMPSLTNPLDYQFNNPNTTLQSWILANNTTVIYPYAYANQAGLAPIRKTSLYKDGSTAAYKYTDSTGTVQTISGGSKISRRNKIAGDFNYDNKCNIDDIDKLMEAVADPNHFEVSGGNGYNWGGYAGDMAGDYVLPYVIGDFDGDGNFDANDVRYFADGLALSGGVVRRDLAFAAVDNKFGGNYFGTTLAHGSWVNGYSMADIAGSALESPAPGTNPRGYDLIVNAADIDYMHKVLRGKLTGKVGPQAGALAEAYPCIYDMDLDWTDLDDAAFMDLSCDMNGDLHVNRADIEFVIETILDTTYGDLNLDGTVSAGEIATITANIATSTGTQTWVSGDMDGDGWVTSFDLAMANGQAGGLCGDLDDDCDVDLNDLQLLAEDWLAPYDLDTFSCMAKNWLYNN